ncbi:hypothetical protein H1P_1830005 [Hyella patelloides LEGE 07179]|uniref:Uncharacterized protein n=1 Tax=Hyella patelloides LEGE 07179 TaxID=945734 RepID=A0A563VP98_9CYAN|nr:hypothetical protein [Hyella patelloides]VEP13107.1 hypothetical protein H1P_1830005 [Hyella patelloides LEGE 07179]
MNSEQLKLAEKIRGIAEDLVVHLYAPPYTINTLKDFINEMSELVDEMEEFEDVDEFLELEDEEE